MPDHYIALLRGINVSGKNIIKMEVLKSLFEQIGFKNVQTYIQSGNIVFSYKKEVLEKLRKKIQESIHKEFGYDVHVAICTAESFVEMVKANPFLKRRDVSEEKLYYTFVSETPVAKSVTHLQSLATEGEEIAIGTNILYLYVPGQYGKTKLSNSFIENKLKLSATTRNLKTCRQLLSMLKG